MKAVVRTYEGGETEIDVLQQYPTLQTEVVVLPGVTCTRIFAYQGEEIRNGKKVLLYQEKDMNYV